MVELFYLEQLSLQSLQQNKKKKLSGIHDGRTQETEGKSKLKFVTLDQLSQERT